MNSSLLNASETLQTSLFSSLFSQESEAAPSSKTLMAQAFDTATFTVIDLETTGLNAKRNSITEITAIQFVNGQAIDIFSTLVQPKEPIPYEVESLTGISNEMVENAPPLMMVLNDLISFMGPAPLLVGHNVSFDIQFLREKCLECGLVGLEQRIDISKAFCTKVLAQKVMPGLPSYEGIVVATQCGYHNNNPHRAEADVRMSAAILFALVEKLRQQGQAITTVKDVLAIQGVLQERG
ncbi:MAG: 3'-5' exonuclease [Vampirovibrio sp.]|jgi:DNA polymerase III epsilon subunit family exonuclease|nr:3'-5' exonuclease [Vampirovibrio sp.]